MRSIKKHMPLWLFVLILALAIPIAANVNPFSVAVVNERHECLYQQTEAESDGVKTEPEFAPRSAVTAPPQDYYDRRRRYWEDRLERDLDEEENGGGDEDAKDAKDDKSAKDDKDSLDKEEEMIERRREYWRGRLDEDW